jgi:hypothetical protein
MGERFGKNREKLQSQADWGCSFLVLRVLFLTAARIRFYHAVFAYAQRGGTKSEQLCISPLHQ